ncbi:MAG TPA: type II CAAX endopeptidase family protein [Mucilaginibacter sp.]|jgi:membrane protease YdiL (CAAX protease family)
MKKIRFNDSIFGIWDGLPLIIKAVLSGAFVSSVGVFTWGAMLSYFSSPWVILPMVLALWAFWKFFSGSWGQKDRGEIKKENFRLTKLTPAVWKIGLTAAILFVIIVQASFVITFRIIEFPANKFTADYKSIDSYPLWIAWVIVIMSSAVAGICEEAGFRGYMQVPIDKRYGPVFGIILTSVVFTLIHLGHTWALPILPHIFFASVLLGILAYRSGSLIPGIVGHSILDIFDYSVWWTDITGGFTKQTIFKTGIDVHFIVWALIFVLALFGFFGMIFKLNAEGTKANAFLKS